MEIIESGVDEWNEWRAENKKNPTLNDLDLSNQDLTEIDFSNCILKNINLRKADLSRSSFKCTQIFDTVFDNCALYKADLQSIIVKNSRLKRVYLEKVILDMATFENCDFNDTWFTSGLEHVSFKNSSLKNGIISSYSLDNCNFTGAKIKNFSISSIEDPEEGIVYSNNCDFSGSNLNNVSFRNNFKNTSFRDTKILNCNFNCTEWDGINFDNSNISKSEFNGIKFSNTNFNNAKIKQTSFINIFFDKIDLSNIQIQNSSLLRIVINSSLLLNSLIKNCDFSDSQITDSSFDKSNILSNSFENAKLKHNKFNDTNIFGCNFISADLSNSDFENSQLKDLELQKSHLIGINLQNASISDSSIYGISIWGVLGIPSEQINLLITNENEPEITVDNLDLAQFIYLLMNNEKLQKVIDTITSKVVLILGRFTEERKVVLDEIRNTLRCRDLTPILFDFTVPNSRNLTETVGLIAKMSKFVICDLTNPSCAPHEICSIVGSNPSVPVCPIIEKGHNPYAMFRDFLEDRTVLDLVSYESKEDIVDKLPTIITNANERRNTILEERIEILKGNN